MIKTLTLLHLVIKDTSRTSRSVLVVTISKHRWSLVLISYWLMGLDSGQPLEYTSFICYLMSVAMAELCVPGVHDECGSGWALCLGCMMMRVAMAELCVPVVLDECGSIWGLCACGTWWVLQCVRTVCLWYLMSVAVCEDCVPVVLDGCGSVWGLCACGTWWVWQCVRTVCLWYLMGVAVCEDCVPVVLDECT